MATTNGKLHIFQGNFHTFLTANSCFNLNTQTNCPAIEQLTIDVKIRFEVHGLRLAVNVNLKVSINEFKARSHLAIFFCANKQKANVIEW